MAKGWIIPTLKTLGASLLGVILSSIINATTQASPVIEVQLTQQDDVRRYRKNIFQRVDKYSISYIHLIISNQGSEAEHDLVVTITLPEGSSIVGIEGFTHFRIRKDFGWHEIGTSFVRIRHNEQALEVRLDRLPPKIQTSIVVAYTFEFDADTPHPIPKVFVYGDNGPASITKQ